MIRVRISATAAKSSPKQGLAAISSDDLVVQLARQHRALHVAARQAADWRRRAPGVRIPYSAISDRAALAQAPRR